MAAYYAGSKHCLGGIVANSNNSESTRRLPDDIWLRRIMKLGLPLGVLTIFLLWAAYLTGKMWMVQSFIGLAALTFAVGVIYNIRLVVVLFRQRRREEE